jgi:hypothetical protein
LNGEEPLGILLYGYERSDGEMIRERLTDLSGRHVDMMDATGMEEKVLMEILDSEGADTYSDGETRILMFLGFDDDLLSLVIDGFPSNEGLKRPIFCTLTLENINWKFKDLMTDLLEEDRYWKAKKAAQRSG